MTERFNPYRQWLGLDADAERLNHYELLGLSLFEPDQETIRHSADRALARVRSHRPGSHAAIWARLLDELGQAKACLTDPAQKASYDAKLHNWERMDEESGSQAAAQGVKRPEVSAVNEPREVVPPGMESAVRAHGGDGPEENSAVPSASTDEAASETAPKTAEKSGVEKPKMAKERPMSSSQVGDATQRQSNPRDAKAGTSGSSSSAGAVERADAILGEVFEGEGTGRLALSEIPEQAPVNAHVAPPHEETSSIWPMVISVAAVLAVTTLVLVLLAIRNRPSTSTFSPPSPNGRKTEMASGRVDAAKPNRSTAHSRNSSPESQFLSDSQPPRRPQDAAPPNNPKRPARDGARGERTLPKDFAGDQSASGVEDSVGGSSQTEASGQAAVPGSSKTSENEQETEAAAPAAGSPNDDAARLKTLLRSARSALAQHAFEEARSRIQQADELVSRPSHQRLVTGFRELEKQGRAFWQTVASVVDQFEGLEEFPVGSSGNMIVLVVETGPQSITVRKAGQTLRYTFGEMPPGLALAIAKTQLDTRNAGDLLQLGAALAMAPERKRIYLEEAARYWRHARATGARVDHLLLTLRPLADH